MKPGPSMFVVWALLSFANAAPSTAATLTVRRDGTGDFAIIQDAVNACASGDTILIGPGRFNEGTIVQVPGWTELVRVLVTVEDLTLIGAGPQATIIGQEADWDLSQGWHRGVQTATYWGTRRLVVEGIRFENMAYAINDDDIAVVEIRNCAFSGNRYSVGDSGGSLLIASVEFERVKRNGVHLVGWDHERLRVSNCTFSHVPDGTWAQSSISVAGVRDGLFEDCRFVGGMGGLGVSSGTTASIRRCRFENMSTGIYSGSGCNLTVEDCTLSGQRLALRLSSDWTVRRTIITDVSYISLWITEFGQGVMNDCHLAKGPRYVVSNGHEPRGAAKSLVHYDLTNNSWGTTDPDSIQAWIWDAHDDPEAGYIIDWRPYVGEPIPTTKRNLGSVKSLFR